MGEHDTSAARVAEQMPTGRHVQEASQAERRWLVQELGRDEVLLAWLGVSRATPAHDAGMPVGRARWRFLMTPERTALVAWRSRRRVRVFELPQRALHVSLSMGRAVVQVGEHRFRSWFNNDALFREVGPVVALDPAARLREIARLNWVQDETARPYGPYARALLASLHSRGDDPLDELTWLMARGDVDPGSNGQQLERGPILGDGATALRHDALGRCLRRLLDAAPPEDVLGRWARRWRVSTADKQVFVDRLLLLEPPRRAARLALSLHRQVRDELGHRDGDPRQAAQRDLSFASHLSQAGSRREAQRILEQRLAALPEPSFDDLGGESTSGDLVVGGELSAIRRDLLEALDSLLGPDDPEHAERATELAQLEPVRPERLGELMATASESLACRAKRLQELLAPGALERASTEPVAATIEPIERQLLEARLPHPAARQHGAVVQIQKWLGRAKQPDYATIKSYSERATEKDHPALLDALADATLALGVDGVEAFVSRGERRVGIRAYEATPPFVVIGGDHLDPQSELWLAEPEIRFLVGTEVAHLRFEHTRLTSSELWDGIIHRGKQALDVAAMLAGPLGALGNLLRGAQQATRVERALRQAGVVSRKVAGVLGIAKELQQVLGDGDVERPVTDEVSAARQGELLAACRAMQLTADRAGLVLAGDVGAAVRALFLTSRVYGAELRMAQRHGLAKTLARRDADGAPPHPELVLRIAALAAFYLSEDFEELRLTSRLA